MTTVFVESNGFNVYRVDGSIKIIWWGSHVTSQCRPNSARLKRCCKPGGEANYNILSVIAIGSWPKWQLGLHVGTVVQLTPAQLKKLPTPHEHAFTVDFSLNWTLESRKIKDYYVQLDHFPSMGLITRIIFLVPYITMHKMLECINKNCINLSRGPFWRIRINLSCT